MDTPWKSRKNASSMMVFILGVSLTLGGMAGILKDKPGNVRVWQVKELFQGDYQQNYRFQDYITGRFWNFVTMATGGNVENSQGYGAEGYWDSGYYGSYGDYNVWNNGWESYQDTLEDMTDGYEEMEEAWRELQENGAYEEAEEFREEMNAYLEEIENYRKEMEIYQNNRPKELTQEEKKKAAQKYHDRIKGDKNLLYTISCENQVLYANSELLSTDGKMTAPEGYNFLLYFDGERVRVLKDGKELDIYGDGYYREENTWQETGRKKDWFVPGYLNFPVDENLKKVKVFLAAAQEPVLYMEVSQKNSGSTQYDNWLYWMDYNCQANQKLLRKEAACALLGLVLLFLAFLSRKSRKEAEAKLAGIQAGIWAECKALLLLGVLFLVFLIIKSSNQGYGLWQELTEVYYYENGVEGLSVYGWEILRNTDPAAWVLLFWGICLVWNDLKYNKKLWINSLSGKLYKVFSLKGISLSLARRMACRNRGVFAGAAFYVLVLLGVAILRINGYKNNGVLTLMAFGGAVLFLLLAYFVGKKNMETARDMETISGCISEIRNGNYRDMEGDFTGHDLQNILAELEDIRHGMEKAVEEQMRSQKMKVELIANVSHDIKTPLTSIISYVQFLKQEEDLPEHVKDYVKILDEKSQRLKNMVQDVFAVSKAASGELPMHMEELDFGKLLNQTMADMEEQIENSAISFRTELPETPVMIRADGERMYRVFQNLFQNAIQYSIAGSRVYVTLQRDGIMAVASVKNASLMELNKEKDFSERFARGDQSRTDGGSGLGLSIAQSFTEACEGEFSWETDADLFVVRVSFRIAG